MKYYTGSTPKLYAYNYNSSGALADTGTSMLISVSDPAGKAIITDAVMTKEDTGIYYYVSLTLATTHIEGIWTYRAKDTTSSMVSIYEGEFEFVKR